MALVVQPLLLFDSNIILVFASFLSGLFSGALSLEIFYPQSTCIQTQWSNQDTTETLSCQKKEPHPSSNYGDNRFASTLPGHYHCPPPAAWKWFCEIRFASHAVHHLVGGQWWATIPVNQSCSSPPWATNHHPPSQPSSHAELFAQPGIFSCQCRPAFQTVI